LSLLRCAAAAGLCRPDKAGPRLQVLRYLDQVQVRISNIHRADAPGRTGARAGPLFDPHARCLEAIDHRLERQRRDEAQVERARHRQVRLRLELGALHMQVDLLVAEAKRLPPLAEALVVHAQHVDVEAHAGGLVGSGEDEVVEVIDHRDSAIGREAAAASVNAPAVGSSRRCPSHGLPHPHPATHA
jgi:hypothetical protein